MTPSSPAHSVATMTTTTQSVSWPLVLGLGAFALIRPVTRLVATQLAVDLPTLVPLALTVVITTVWVAVVGLGRTSSPVLTLLFSGLTYALLSLVVSGVVSPILDGELRGPLASPAAIIPFLALNAGWGLLAGFLALGVQRARDARGGAGPRTRPEEW